MKKGLSKNGDWRCVSTILGWWGQEKAACIPRVVLIYSLSLSLSLPLSISQSLSLSLSLSRSLLLSFSLSLSPPEMLRNKIYEVWSWG